MKFTIDRNTWRRGQGSIESRLLREDGQRCCLGFLGQACGLPDEALLERTLFNVLSKEHQDLIPSFLLSACSPSSPITNLLFYNLGEEKAECSFARLNDSELITNDERERLLTQWFAAYDIQVEFIN